VFRELISVNEQNTATRRRAPCRHLFSSVGAGQLVDAFTDARLLVTDRDSTGEEVVEVAHEALLAAWPRLANWIAERSDDFRLLRQVEAAAIQWKHAGCGSTYIWPYERLVVVYQALSNLGTALEGLDETTRSFCLAEAILLIDELKTHDTTHYRRVAIGERLDLIGDPRRGTGLKPDGTPEIEWCDVPSVVDAGETGRDVLKVQRFRMAKYPVTYSQYKVFLDEANGYRAEKWWSGLSQSQQSGRQLHTAGNAPADRVSWYDAMAYCRWLSMRLGYEVRLPTESEWKHAATSGNPDNQYPWGREWMPSLANTSEAFTARTSAVGMYPNGCSPEGILDLAGNVFEWCGIELPQGPHQGSEDAPGKFPLHGGSWGYGRSFARASHCLKLDPDERRDDVGFRLVCAPP
jgi:hypothetical protein